MLDSSLGKNNNNGDVVTARTYVTNSDSNDTSVVKVGKVSSIGADGRFVLGCYSD